MTREENGLKIKECCKAMRISSRFAERALEVAGDDACLEYITKLLMTEVECRNEARYMKRLNEAGFPCRYQPEEFDSSEVVFPQGLTLEILLDLGFLDEHTNVVMSGNSGTGKSMLSIILGILSCMKADVLYYRTSSLLRMLAHGPSTEKQKARFQAKVDRASLIILDEFGYVPYTPEDAQRLFEFISEANDDKSIILNTNIGFTEWGNVLHDDQLTSAILGRIVQHCHLLMFNGRNRRLTGSSALGPNSNA